MPTGSPRARDGVAGLLAVALTLRAGTLGAQAPSALAEALFQEGRQLLEQGDLARACPKLAESQRLEPSSGTLLNLADCHEREGKTATAWAEFQGAERMARAQGRAVHAAEADRRAQRLVGRVSHVEIHLAAPLPGVVVRLAGVALAASSLDTRLPVDPGEIDVSAEAPGRVPWSTRVTVGPGPGVQRVLVPGLDAARLPGPEASAGPARSAGPRVHMESPDNVSWSGHRTAAVVTGGAGLVVLGVGAILGLSARATYHTAERACPSHTGCSPDAITRRGHADTLATASDVGFGLGAVAVGVAAYLWFSAPAGGAAASAPVSGSSGLPVSGGRWRWWPTGTGVRGEF